MTPNATGADSKAGAYALTFATAMISGFLFSVSAPAETQQEKFASILAKADAAYGEYLAGQCVACHRVGGGGDGIPPIAGLPDIYIVQAMLDYKNAREERTNPAMVNVAKNLSDEELGSLALHFSKLKAE